MVSGEESDYRSEMYFIIPRRNNAFLIDVTALRMLNELHRSRTIRKVFLKFEESFPVVERYCIDNDIQRIDIARISDSAEITKEVDKSEDFKTYAYVSASEKLGSLEDVRRELLQRDFYLETRIANSA